MPGTICFTSFTFGYLSRARVLAQTLKAAHPDWAIWALLVDQAPPDFDQAAAFAPFDRLVPAASLGIPGFRGWMFKHRLVEACTAVKAPMLAALLDQGADRVIYLDPDIAVFEGLHGIARRLDRASIVLTPHQQAPNATAQAIRDNELTSMQYGVFNLGFVAVRNDAAGRDFARWWTRMTHDACYDDVANGIFTDQKYCDLVPGLFDGVCIERDPGCNVASWNLSRRGLGFTAGGELHAGPAPLAFYHFTKIDAVGTVMTERYAGDNVEVYELVSWYLRRLRANEIAGADAIPWQDGHYENGEPIADAARLLWRGRPDLQAAFADPFAVGPGGFHAWLQDQTPEDR